MKCMRTKKTTATGLQSSWKQRNGRRHGGASEPHVVIHDVAGGQHEWLRCPSPVTFLCLILGAESNAIWDPTLTPAIVKQDRPFCRELPKVRTWNHDTCHLSVLISDIMYWIWLILGFIYSNMPGCLYKAWTKENRKQSMDSGTTRLGFSIPHATSEYTRLFLLGFWCCKTKAYTWSSLYKQIGRDTTPTPLSAGQSMK